MLINLDCSSGVPGIQLQVVNGTNYYRLACVDSSGSLLAGANTMTSSPVSMAIETSDPVTGFTDGATLGWGVVAAMAMAWAITHLRRAL